MRIRETIVAAGLITITTAVLAPREAAAQAPPTPTRDHNWDTISNITMAVGVLSVSLMPRVYYNDPEATVGWKGRWHFSALAPVMSMTALTLLVDGPIKGAIKATRPGCNIDQTTFPLTECASFGMPSTQAYASYGALGGGLGIFLVDTFKYSDSRFSAPSFIGNVALPLTLSVLTTVGRVVEPGTSRAYEDGPQVAAGAISGFVSGMLVGLGYALFQRPGCGYGNNIFCW